MEGHQPAGQGAVPAAGATGVTCPSIDGAGDQFPNRRRIPLLGEERTGKRQENEQNPVMTHRHKIPVGLGVAATLAAAIGCGGGTGAGSAGTGTPPPRVPPAASIETVFLLESSGVPPDDTTVAVPRAAGRVVILRRGAPDNSLFAEVAVAAASGDGVPGTGLVEIRPRPGLYGLDLAGDLPAGSRVTFSYGVHFVAPAGARERYRTDLAFEEALWVARVDPGGRVVFLPSTRPGSDLLSAIVSGPGRYVVAAPRS